MDNKYSNLELSKWLAAKGFKKRTEYYWNEKTKKLTRRRTRTEYKCYTLESGEDAEEAVIINNLPAYDILNDLCVKYLEEVWGKDTLLKGTMEKHLAAVWARLILDSSTSNQLVEKYIIQNCSLANKNIPRSSGGSEIWGD